MRWWLESTQQPQPAGIDRLLGQAQMEFAGAGQTASVETMQMEDRRGDGGRCIELEVGRDAIAGCGLLQIELWQQQRRHC